jgi:hypothetical protein
MKLEILDGLNERRQAPFERDRAEMRGSHRRNRLFNLISFSKIALANSISVDLLTE